MFSYIKAISARLKKNRLLKRYGWATMCACGNYFSVCDKVHWQVLGLSYVQLYRCKCGKLHKHVFNDKIRGGLTYCEKCKSIVYNGGTLYPDRETFIDFNKCQCGKLCTELEPIC